MSIDISYPAVALSTAGWIKALDELTDASPNDDLVDWQGLRIFDAEGKAFHVRRAYRRWPASRIGLLLCRLTNQSIFVGFELEPDDGMELAELATHIGALESLPHGVTWKSQRELVEYLSQ